MASTSENLQTAYDNLAARLAAITASPKPSYSENGRTMNWVEYQQFLLTAMKELKLLMNVETDGAWEIISQGVT